MKKIMIIVFVLVLGYFGIQHFSNNVNVENTTNQNVEITEELDIDVSDELIEDILEETGVKEEFPVVVNRTTSQHACIGEFCGGSGVDDSFAYSVVNIPLLVEGTTFGCGVDVVFAPHAVPQTAGVLNATYELLFDLLPGSAVSGDPRNPLGNYTQVDFDSVSIVNGVAKVMLIGSMNGGPGHCSLPEVRAQISQTALQFASVDIVEVYLNGAIYDWCEMDESDGEGGCPATTQLWIDTQ